MYLYSNGFNAAINDDRDEVALCFIQNCPIVKEDGIMDFDTVSTVTSVVLNPRNARDLANNILKLLDGTAETNNDDLSKGSDTSI